MSKIVTRFAPSPTGYLHIGGARTALFNWLFARHFGGKFLLRIEDTDRTRSSNDAIEAILSGLEWLGLSPDEPAMFQSDAASHHGVVVQQMLAKGTAYHCYMSPEDMDAEKQSARQENRRFVSPWREREAAEYPADAPFAVRLKAPLSGETVIEDAVQGRVTFQNQQLDDLVLLRADQSPTYMLAVVVDDHDMEVSHVIRGDDHLVNAARQKLIYQAMEWSIPVFAHIPLIHGPDGKKLSKRHGALGIDAYQAMGYLPEAIRSYLLRLGWSHGDQEIFSDEEAISAFSLSGINKGSSRLDFEKMANINSHFLKLADPEMLCTEVCNFMASDNGIAPDTDERERILSSIPHLVSRAKLIPDLVKEVAFLIQKRPLTLNKNARKSINEERTKYLEKLIASLSELENWDVQNIHKIMQDFANQHQIGFGKFGPILRAAISGGLPAPDLALACALLGKKETLGRVDDLLANRLS
ncbi:MAG: glutamate--tRNA ligase [Robiginitomaculum sp.]|nr:MAG: glutamate--tRNA ligase [Robiginitomaculum sp.]